LNPPSNFFALSVIPDGLRSPLIRTFKEIVTNYRERRWEPSELNGGKFCECVFSVLDGYLRGQYQDAPSKPKNFVGACKNLELLTGGRSERIQIPRMLVVLYEIRNNRGVGHVGGDVDSNAMDASVVLNISKWIMAELVRIFHTVSTEEATTIVDHLIERTIPIVWDTGLVKRVLACKLPMKDQMLLLLYSELSKVAERQLLDWVEHSNPAIFRRDIIKKAHKSRLIEYDKISKTVQLSPLGIRYVEEFLIDKN